MSGTILGDPVKKWFERKEKERKGEKIGIEVESWAEESIVSRLFLENNLATRCEGVENSGVKGRASTYSESTDEQTRMKKGGEESEGSGGEGDGKRMERGGRRKWKRRKDGSKKRRGSAIGRRVGFNERAQCVAGKARGWLEGERRKEAKQRGPIKAESDLNLERLMHEKPGY